MRAAGEAKADGVVEPFKRPFLVGSVREALVCVLLLCGLYSVAEVADHMLFVEFVRRLSLSRSAANRACVPSLLSVPVPI